MKVNFQTENFMERVSNTYNAVADMRETSLITNSTDKAPFIIIMVLFLTDGSIKTKCKVKESWMLYHRV